jgi:acyl-CoA synthetase (AMP-forming)/AMP-acid ligase II
MNVPPTATDERGITRYDLGLAETLVAVFAETVERDPLGVAIYDGETTMTWAGLAAEVELLARRLRAFGIGARDRVALLAGNGAPFLVGTLAVWQCGAVLVPLNHRLAQSELATLIADADAGVLLATSEFEALGAASAGKTPFEVHDGSGWLGRVEPAGEAEAEIEPGSPAAILYTSGTTGRPKGVVVSHDNVLQNAATCIAVLGRRAGDRELIMVPAFNVTGLCSQAMPAIALGLPIVFCGAFEPRAVLCAIERHGATSTVGAPTMWRRLLDAAESEDSTALAGLRLALFGGAPMPTALLARMREAMPSASFGNGYGQTETCSMVTYVGGEAVLERPESVGEPLPITDLRIVDPDTREEVDPGREGELMVRGPQIALGYRMGDELKPIADSDGWASTGDLAVLDRGMVVLRDRLKDVIKRGGESVYSFEVEECLAQHPDVLEVAVLGLPDPDLGESVAAAVVLQPECELSTESLRDHCLSSLARFKVPRSIERFDQLPRNAGGKVLKKEIRSLILSRRESSGSHHVH